MKRLPTKRQNICGKYIRPIRKQQKLTQADLAAKLQLKGLVDFDRLVVCRIERGTRQVSDVELKYLASALNVSLDSLMYGNCAALPTFEELDMIAAEPAQPLPVSDAPEASDVPNASDAPDNA